MQSIGSVELLAPLSDIQLSNHVNAINFVYPLINQKELYIKHSYQYETKMLSITGNKISLMKKAECSSHVTIYKNQYNQISATQTNLKNVRTKIALQHANDRSSLTIAYSIKNFIYFTRMINLHLKDKLVKIYIEHAGYINHAI